ncbi:lauroyl-Kdo(2)-lipid IV(A) myristoyltransferase [Psychrobium sp. 1_MG-2023]|uniref:LpxL/LpxP family acyltransferase n=1 Tax=Psychrobium sp. 1_MG-2023 TaxID=3062624 RepID=UPI000C32E3E3|nr:lauroyl-Kdo(2)-lipid IV(A) myristoyltransferase [Psychrobium sp. 1_MG-2023]MDP2560130.1 lauroyl-Kdo(2)-lipid IV(A) myristoyltransferase [Psychrobium sp. 1_MG-2023]PKF56943.1 lauroyl-Kdo(2)-lipid IV(A) myristoyltransferase [Alteromonadales bacterium alter-6D02]
MSVERFIYRAPFSWRWLHPKYIGTWFAVLLLIICAYIPPRIRDKFALSLTSLVLKIAKKPVRIIDTNLRHCFTHLSEDERKVIIRKNIGVFLQTILGQGELVFRSKKYIETRFDVEGWEHFQKILDNNEQAIFLIPHQWGLEYAGTYFLSQNIPLVAFVNQHKNPIYNWLSVKQRTRFCDRVFVREGGIRVMISGIKEGKHLFYLPDEDHGAEISEFAPFFDTEKATLPVLSRIGKATGARILPLSIAYDGERHRFKLEVEPPYDCSGADCKESEALFLNSQMERLIARDLSQYMWMLRILKTRPPGQERFY